MHLPMRTIFLVSSLMSLSACSTLSALWPAQEEVKTTTEQGSNRPSVQPIRDAAQSLATGPIQILWSKNVDQRIPGSPMGFSLPTSATTAQGERVVIGGQDKRVRIYDNNGSEISRVALSDSCESGGLQLSNGLVVVGDLSGVIYGLDVQHSKVVWRFDLPSALIGQPVVYGDGFIIQTSNNQLYRFSNKGKKIWSYSDGLGGLSMHLSPSPVVHNQRVYAALSNGDVIALKADSGSFIWKRQLLLSNKASVMSQLKVPVAMPLLITAAQSGRDEDMLLVPVFQGELSFLSLQDGSTLSRRKLSLKSSPILIDRLVYVADSSGALSALNAADGETVWKQQLSDGELTGPVLWKGSLWVADDKATVYRLSQTGELMASTDLNGRIDRAPVAGNQGILVRNNLGTLYMLR